MTGRRLPRPLRGRALPSRAGTDTVSWPPALRGRSTLLCVAVLGWLGGGLSASVVAVVTESPNDLTYGLTNTVAACLGLLLLAIAPRGASTDRRGARAHQPMPLDEPVPVRVPAQAEHGHDDVRDLTLR